LWLLSNWQGRPLQNPIQIQTPPHLMPDVHGPSFARVLHLDLVRVDRHHLSGLGQKCVEFAKAMLT